MITDHWLVGRVECFVYIVSHVLDNEVYTLQGELIYSTLILGTQLTAELD